MYYYAFRSFAFPQEHIRQSRENRLDELGRKSTPCPISSSRTDLHERGSESPSLEVLPSKELMPPTTMISQEYTKDLVLEIAYNASDITDIHQSNNVSNATQERLQESSEEPEMRDNSCQTRESLFEPRILDAMAPMSFTTFGVRAPSSQNGTNFHHHYHHHHPQQQQQSPQRSHLESVQSSQPSSQPSTQTSQHSSHQQSISQCSGCSPASRGRDGSMGVCPKHNPIPAPPGWSMHESSYPLSMPQVAQYPEQLDYPSYQRYQSPKPGRDISGVYRQSPKFARQPTVGSGERYGSSVYGSGHASSNTTSSTSQHSSGNTPTKRQPMDPRYRAEAVIEVDQRRPFSIESTKSAPDVIATHWRRDSGDWEPYKRRHPRQNYSAAIRNNVGNKVTVATQSSLDDDASTSSTMEANSSSWSTYRDAIERERSPVINESCNRDSSRINQSSKISDVLTHIHLIEEKHIEKPADESSRLEKSVIIDDASSFNTISINADSRLNSFPTHNSINRAAWTTAGDSLISKPWRRAETALKLHDLPILRPPEGFRVPVFKCKTPSLSWQHCGCSSHTHPLPRRSSITWSAFERCSVDPMYRTWPNRTARRLGRPTRRTVGTQSSLDGIKSSLGFLRCVVRSIDMTKRSLDQEIGASIPF